VDQTAALTANAKTTLAQGITTAKHQVGGNAAVASIEVHLDKEVYAIDAFKDGQIYAAIVDIQTGTIADTFETHDDEDEDDCGLRSSGVVRPTTSRSCLGRTSRK